MAALSAILGSPRMMPYAPVKRNSNPMSYPPQQYHTQPQQQQQQQRPYQKNEGGKKTLDKALNDVLT